MCDQMEGIMRQNQRFQKQPYIVMFIVSTLFSGCIGVTAVNENVSVRKVIQVEVKKKPSDTEWTKQDTRTIDMLAGFEPDQTKIELDTYGGRTDRQVEATGFIYPKKIDGRWWLVDPQGCLFIHTAIACVYTGLSDTDRENTLTRFGSVENLRSSAPNF